MEPTVPPPAGPELEPSEASRRPLQRIPARWSIFSIALLGLLAWGLWLRFTMPRPLEPIRSAARPTSLAVVPFANTDPDSTDDYLGYGLALELSRALGKVAGLRIAPSTSSLAFASRRVDPLLVGRRLEAGSVLQGTIRRSEDRLRVTARLVDAAEGFDLWSETYDRMPGDLPALIDEISRAVATTFRINPTPVPPSPKGREAYDAYLSGLYLMERQAAGDRERAIERLSRAVELDSSFAPAYAAQAGAYLIDGGGAERQPAVTASLATVAATRALELDSTLAGPHTTLGTIRFEYDRNWRGAEAEFRRAIALEPDAPDTYQAYSRLLLAMGRTGESLESSQRAHQLSPLAPRYLEQLGWHHLHAREPEPAREALGRAIALDSANWRPRAALALLEQSLGHYGEALEQLRFPLAVEPDRADLQAALGQLYALSGRREDAETTLRTLLDARAQPYVPSYLIACLQASLGRRNEAFAALELAVKQRSRQVPYLRIDPRLDTLRADRRFARLLRQVQLP